MSIAPTSTSLKDSARLVKNISNWWDLGLISDKLQFDFEEIENTAAAVISGIDKLKELTTIKHVAVVLDDTDRALSLKDSIAAIAGELRGGRVFAGEAFKSAVERNCEPSHREFWSNESEGLMRSLIGEQDGIASLLKHEGILVWIGCEHDPGEELIRVVNVHWLSDESDIHGFVVNSSSAGKLCRFCNALESPESLALQPLDPEQRGADTLRAGMNGKRIAILQPGQVYCHEPCIPYWLEWLRMSEALEERCPA